MFCTWDPREPGVEPTTFNFDSEELYGHEAKLIEKHYGESIEQFLNALRMKEAKAREVLLWWHLSQTHPHLQFKDTPRFRLAQLKVEMNVAELRELSKRLTQMKMDDERREAIQAAFDIDIREAMAREGLIEGDVVDNLPKPA